MIGFGFGCSEVIDLLSHTSDGIHTYGYGDRIYIPRKSTNRLRFHPAAGITSLAIPYIYIYPNICTALYIQSLN